MKQLSKALSLSLLLAAGASMADEAGEKLSQARGNLDKGDAKAAAIQLKSLLQETPENAEARLTLGQAYLQLGDAAAAVKELERARDAGLAKERWIVFLGQAYLRQGQLKTLLEKIVAEEQLPPPVRAELLALQGQARIAMNEPDKAKELLEKSLQIDSKNANALLGLAMIEAGKKNYKAAADFLGKSVANDPKNGPAWAALAEVKRLEGDLPASIDAFSKAVNILPTDAKARLGRAIAYIASNKLDEAQKDVDAVRKFAGDVPMAMYAQGLIAFQRQNFQDAEDALSKAESAMPDFMPLHFLLGAIAFQQNELESAESHLSKFIKAAPDHLPAAKLLGAARLKRDRPGEVIELLRPLADKNPKDAQLYAILGSAYLKKKQYDQGVEYLNRSAEIAPDVAAVRAELGLGRIAAGKTDEGVADLKSAVNIDPKLIQADVTLVLALLQQKKFDEAIAEAKKLKGKRDDDPMPDNLLGGAYMAKGDIDKAQEHWRKALEIKPDYVSARLNLAKLAMSRNKPEEAAKEYESILKHDGKNLSALIGQAQLAEQAKDYGKMVKFLEEAKDKNPKNPEPAIMLTRYYLSQGKGLQALDIASAAESGNPDNPAVIQNLGLAQLGANQAASAVVLFKRLVDKIPENPEYRHNLAQALFKTGDKKAATKQWDEALMRAPDYVPAMLAKTELAMQDKRYDEAAKIAATIENKFPKAPLGYQLEGDAAVAQKQFKAGLAAYDKAYAIAPSSYLARRLFQARRELHENRAAYDGLEKWLESANNDVESWMMLAGAYQQDGDNAKAVSAYEKAYALKPDNALIQNNLAWIYQESGNKKALELAEKIVLKADSNPEILDTVGWIFLHNGKVEQGLVLLQQAAVQAPHIAQIRLHLAQAFAKSGKKDEARQELERLLKEKKEFAERKQAEDLLRGL